MRVVLRGSRISDTHLPPRIRIPRYFGCLLADTGWLDDPPADVAAVAVELEVRGVGNGGVFWGTPGGLFAMYVT